MRQIQVSSFLVGIVLPLFLSANPINDIPLRPEPDSGLFNFFIEIPAGTNQKWEVNSDTGELEWEVKNGKKRLVMFLPYPGNYGFLPQTLGGDGDPIDVVTMDVSSERGTINPIRIIGGMNFFDGGDEDIKLIGFTDASVFSKYESIEELLLKKPGAVSIFREWFESYKKPGKMIFHGFISREDAIQKVLKGHNKWLEHHRLSTK